MTLDLNPALDGIEFPIHTDMDRNPPYPRILIAGNFLQIRIHRNQLIIDYFWQGWTSAIMHSIEPNGELLFRLVWDFPNKRIQLQSNNNILEESVIVPPF